jgi:peptide deformylase
MEIKKYRDQVLVTPAEPVTSFDDELRALVDEMWASMYDAHGVGLAAPQVGVSKRLFVMDCSTEERPAEKIVMANPEILTTDGTQGGTEGCLSVPGIYSELARPMRVRARGQNLDGEWFEIEVEGLEARCVMHETDHLDGKLYIDRLSPLKRDLIRRKIRKRQKMGDW